MYSISIPNVTGVSLNLINKDLIEYLSNMFEVHKNNLYGDILLQHHMVDRANFNAIKKILIQPADGTIIEKAPTFFINKYDLVITPAENSKKILIESGVDESKIKIIPNYYNESLLEDNGFFNELFKEEKYTFYTESSGIIRKNVFNIVKYFAKTFSSKDNVRLIIKLSKATEKRVQEIKDSYSDIEDLPEIHIINRLLPEEHLNSMMHGINCYICLSYMEGFCIPLLNAAVLKKDIIAINSEISGYTDFLNPKNAILIGFNNIKIDDNTESTLIYSKESIWEEANYEEYQQSLVSCLKGTYKFEKSDDFSKFSKKVVMEQYKTVIDSFLPEIDVEKEIRLTKAKRRRGIID
jgi:glycosyltransferase involved in cell wall biosynthesis